MKKFKKIIFTVIILSFLSTATNANTLMFDETEFTLEFAKCYRTYCVNEYLPTGQKPRNWEEMITIKAYPNGTEKDQLWRERREVERTENKLLLSYSPKILSLSYLYQKDSTNNKLEYNCVLVKAANSIDFQTEYEEEEDEDESEELEKNDENDETVDNDNTNTNSENSEDDEENEENTHANDPSIYVFTYTKRFTYPTYKLDPLDSAIKDCRDKELYYHELVHSTKIPEIIKETYDKERLKWRY